MMRAPMSKIVRILGLIVFLFNTSSTCCFGTWIWECFHTKCDVVPAGPYTLFGRTDPVCLLKRKETSCKFWLDYQRVLLPSTKQMHFEKSGSCRRHAPSKICFVMSNECNTLMSVLQRQELRKNTSLRDVKRQVCQAHHGTWLFSDGASMYSYSLSVL